MSSFHWKIPQFPVICLEFNVVTFMKCMELHEGVVQTCDLPNISIGEFRCTSSCDIDVNGKMYKVLWKLHKKSEATFDCGIQEHPEESTPNNAQCGNEYLAPNDEEASTTHRLQFKVLGTCYSTSRQNALENAYMHLNEHNRPVFVKLVPEPDNVHDKHAIAIYIMSSSESYEKVGYIASELTKYVHPVLNQQDLEVDVDRIWFCIKFKMVGFYLTIGITRKGLWDNAVVQASKKVC